MTFTIVNMDYLSPKVSVGRIIVAVVYFTDYRCTPKARNMAHYGEMFHIIHVYFARIYFGVNFHICINVEGIIWNIIVRMPGHLRYC